MNGNQPSSSTSRATADKQQSSRKNGNVSLRGCWELLIKVIILLILIAIFISYWFGLFGAFGPKGRLDPWTWITVLLLILLLIWLIWRQKHFVCLKCGVTQPTGCKHGDANI